MTIWITLHNESCATSRPVVREVAVVKHEPALLVAFEIVGPFEEPSRVVTGCRCVGLRSGRG